jgi:hypothetical protein
MQWDGGTGGLEGLGGLGGTAPPVRLFNPNGALLFPRALA